MKKDEVLDLIMKSAPSDYTYDDYDGLYMYNSDINLRFLLDKSDEFKGPFSEPWVSEFSDKPEKGSSSATRYLATPHPASVLCLAP